MQGKICLHLFITGETSRSENAMVNLRAMTSGLSKEDYELRVTDVLDEPELAERWKIIATPTLVRVKPQPERRIIGDLRDMELVWRSLGLDLENLFVGEVDENE